MPQAATWHHHVTGHADSKHRQRAAQAGAGQALGLPPSQLPGELPQTCYSLEMLLPAIKCTSEVVNSRIRVQYIKSNHFGPQW